MKQEYIYRYKYRSFEKEYHLDIISKGILWFASPLTFNDPFDCRPQYLERRASLLFRDRPDLKKMLADHHGVSPAKRIMSQRKYEKTLDAKISNGRYVDEYLERMGIFSCSRVANNILMWSHYAYYHTGFVVELKFLKKGSVSDVVLLEDKIFPQKVEYTNNRPIYDISKRFDNDKLRDHFLTKHIDWSYEQEERLIDIDLESRSYKYNRNNLLVSVIAGMNIDKKNYETLISCVRDVEDKIGIEIPIYKAEPVKDRYAIYIPGHPRANRDGL